MTPVLSKPSFLSRIWRVWLSNRPTELLKLICGKTHGPPFHRDQRGKECETGFVVLGMGKLGGRELNYSSDVDLIYLYESREGETRAKKGQRKISNEQYFETLARELTGALADATQEGTVFRVDLRLRPEGSFRTLSSSSG